MNNEGIHPKTSLESIMIDLVDNCSNLDDRDKVCRDIISLTISKDFDVTYKNSLKVANIYDLAIRYLDKDVIAKDEVWEELKRTASR